MVLNRYLRNRFVAAGLVLVFLFLALSACTPTVEEAPTQTLVPTAELTEALPSTTTPPPIPSETIDPITPDPTLEEPTQEPDLTPVSRLGEQIPLTNDIKMMVLDQYGGVPLALDVEGDRAYLGFGPRLVALDVSDPAQPSFLGESEPLPGLIRDIDVEGGIAYLAASNAGLVTVDVSNPANLVIVSDGPHYDGATRPDAEEIMVIGDQAFLMDFNRSDSLAYLLRFNVSDPAQVQILDALELDVNDSFIVDEETIYIVGNGRLQLRATADPSTLLSNTPLVSGSYLSRIAVTDGIATVLESGGPNGIERFDMSEPTAPGRLGELTELDIFLIDQVVSDGSTLYSAETFGEFGYCASQIIAIDLSENQPQSLFSEDPKNCVSELVFQDDRLYVAGRSGLQIFDVSDRSQMKLIGQFYHPDGFQDVQGVAQHQNATYLVDADGSSFDLITLNLDQQEPALMADRLTVSSSTLLDPFVLEDILVIPQWMGGLFTLDITDPASPQVLHEPVEGDYPSGDFFTVVIGNDVLYLPVIGDDYVGGIGAFDLSDPANPSLAAVVETNVPQVMSIVGDGQNLFALTQGMTNQIHSIDISRPLEPVLIGELRLPKPASRLALVGQTLFAACDHWNCQSLFGIDVSDPANPRLIQRWSLPFGVMDMVATESGIIYVDSIGEGIWALDAGDPADLKLSGPLRLAGDFTRFEIIGDRLIVAAFDAGLYLIQIQP